MAGILDGLTSAQQIEAIYVAYFGRAADGGGYIYWENAAHTMSPIAIANSFAVQTESQNNYALLKNPIPTQSLSPTDPVQIAAVDTFLTEVYQNLFNRGPDSGGLSYWQGQILSGKVTIGAAVYTIANGALGVDATAVIDKIGAATSFTTQTYAANQGTTSPLTGSFLHAAEAAVVSVVDATTEAASALASTAYAHTPAFAITASAGTITDGSSETFHVTTTGTAAGTQLAYTIIGTGDAATNTTSGVVTIDANGTGAVTVAVPTATGPGNPGTLLMTLVSSGAVSPTVTVTDTAPAVSYAITASAATIADGQSETFNLATTGIAAGTQLAYTITGTGDAASDTASGIVTIDANGNAAVTVAVPHATVPGNPGTLVMALANGQAVSPTVTVTDTVPVGSQTFALTTGVDAAGVGAFATSAITGNNNVVYGSIAGGGTDGTPGTGATFTAGDQVIAPATGTNNTLTLTDLGTGGFGDPTVIPGTTVSNIETLNIFSGESVNANTATSAAGFSGLTQLTVHSASNDMAGPDTITAAATTNVTVTDASTGTSNSGVSVNGGLNVAVTESGGGAYNSVWVQVGDGTHAGDPAGTVNVTITGTGHTGTEVDGGTTVNVTTSQDGGVYVGWSAAPSGAVTVIATNVDNSEYGDNTIQVGNGATVLAPSTVTVTTTELATQTESTADHIVVWGGTVDTITANLTGAVDNTITGGTIDVTGGAATTTVSVTQTAAATASATVSGVVDGVVTITDANASSTTVANTITSVTLANYGDGSVINDNALTSLSLTGGTGTLTLNNSATAPTNTTLALALNGVGSSSNVVTLNDANHEIKTLNITTGASASTVYIQDTGATAENVSGASVLTQSDSMLSGLMTIAISGAAGLVDTSDFGASTFLTTVTDTSSGTVTLALNDTVATFSGASPASGTEIITITQDATKAITGNGLATSEIVFNAAAGTFTAANTGAHVTGFRTLGVGAAGSGTFNMAASPFAGYTSIDDQGSAGAVNFTGVTAGTSLAIDAANAGNVGYQLATAGTAVNVTLGVSAAESAILGLPATTGGFTATSQLTLWDSSYVGLANVNFTVNNSTAGSAETLTILNDQSLSSLSVAGTGDLIIGGAAYADSLAALSITDNSTSTAGLTFTIGITDGSLTSLALSGSNTAAMTLGTLTDAATSLTLTDSYAGNVGLTVSDAALTTESFTNSSAAGVLTLGSNVGTALASLTLVGAVADTISADHVVSGITVSGGGAAPDNSAVSFTVSSGYGATWTNGTHITSDSFILGNGAADTIVDPGTGNISVTLGSGADDSVTLGVGHSGTTQTVILGSAATGTDVVSSDSVGTVHITLGTGANTVTTAAGATVTESFGAHAPSVFDAVSVGASGASTTAIASITGLSSLAAGHDTITFSSDLGATGAVVNENASIGTYLSTNSLTATLANDVAAVLSSSGGNLAQHAIGEFVFSGDTYLVEQAGTTGSALATGDTLVHLVGITVTDASSATSGVLHLLG